MSKLKAVHAFDVYDAYTKTGDDDAAQVYQKAEADKVIAEKDKEIARLDDLAHAHNIELLHKENLIEEITEKAISMFRDSNKCRGLDLKSPLGRIADVAFKHWNHVEFIQSKNKQLQENENRLLQNNYYLQDEVEHLKKIINEIKRRECHNKYKRCLAMAKWCDERICRIERDYVFWQYGKDYAQNFYKKWRKRWLAIAEKFKPNSTAQLG